MSLADAGSSKPKAAPNRVAQAQAQARPTLVLVALFLLAAAVAGAVPHSTGPWLPLHLALAGALLLAISGVTQFLGVTWGAAPAPNATLVMTQRVLIAAGTVMVAVGREVPADALTGLGGLLVIAGLVVLIVILVGIGRNALQRRLRPAIVAYVAGALLGLVGITLGAILGSGGGGGWYGQLREVHATINLLGLSGLVIAGTLPFFVATQAKVKPSKRATQRAQFGMQAVMAVALVLAVVGLLGEWKVVATAGFGLYAATLLALVGLLPNLGGKQFHWAGPRLVQASASIAWWIGGVTLAAVHAADGRAPISGAVIPALAIGAYVQLLVASLSYLGPVLVGGGHQRLTANFAITRSWVGLVAGNVVAIAACAGLGRPIYAGALAAWTVDGTVRATLLIRSRLRPEV
ncbi:MAG: hypothetical protein KA973_05120 [Candidatus Microthrix sp.]|jgi:hypothetical protein|uniref:hypothetical protein n=1 Tax=Candidatus Neomicrothrix TaxID=41949 RepID=UPI00035E5C91|nr:MULTISPECIES: hypothetical protein [Microthrix]MBK7321477.1 hypothetical protein [Candidatus Microthrix sp.]MBL0205691.1 hypothetical protein [Candidatus Microthrix sp.]MBP6133645.1 hypothetical protein [Candidatus Microthrix sp.]MBP6148498.1 hypothetical protein [Candidatus Microthrix sp.]MBP7404286.1 hypothetical protein [Candidatus Microthrix sp.]